MTVNSNNCGGRLLIVDGNDRILRFLADNLTGDEQRRASADAAETLLDRDPVDLLVVDVNGNTLALLHSIRRGEIPSCGPDLPVVVLAGNDDELHRTRLLELGADDAQQNPLSYPSCVHGSPRCCAVATPTPDRQGGSVRIDVHHGASRYTARRCR